MLREVGGAGQGRALTSLTRCFSSTHHSQADTRAPCLQHCVRDCSRVHVAVHHSRPRPGRAVRWVLSMSTEYPPGNPAEWPHSQKARAGV